MPAVERVRGIEDGGVVGGKLSPAEKELLSHCKGNVQAEEELAELLTAFSNTHMSIGPGGMCPGWMNDFLAALPRGFRDRKTTLKVLPWQFLQDAPNWLVGGLSAIMRFFGDTYNRPGHFAAQITFPDGYTVYFDDGWAGTDGMFHYGGGGIIPPPGPPLSGGTQGSWP